MRKILILMFVGCFILSFCILKDRANANNFSIAYLEDIYISTDEGNYDEKTIDIFIGVFPKANDTISIYKLSNDQEEKPEKFSFWSKKDNDKSVTFYCAQQDDVKVTFVNRNTIIVNNDIYMVNNEYYNFLKQKVFEEQSILDLAFFLKDGYGDYAQTLEPLNKNWRNQKEINSHKIIEVKIKNRNYQTDDHFFEYKANYKYKKDGQLEEISGESRYNKLFEEENDIYIKYSIQDGKNERSSSSEELYKNKRTLFDSIIGSWTQNSTARTSYYTKYQSKLEIKETDMKPKNLNELIKIFNLKNN